MSIVRTACGTTADGLVIEQLTLTSGRGASVTLLSWGALVQAVRVPDRRGALGTVESAEGTRVRFGYVSVDGEEGYPGTLRAAVTYGFDDEHMLTIGYEAETDRATVVNLTNHSYFNLAGGGNILAQASHFVVPARRACPREGGGGEDPVSSNDAGFPHSRE